MKKLSLFLFLTFLLFSCDQLKTYTEKQTKKMGEVKQPNILFAVSDDQSYPHASAYGCWFVNTPAFDRVASEGILFNNAFSASPGCAPSRAALLTGMNDWQIEQAGTHASSFPLKYTVYPDIIENAGYFVGYTRKGWGPGNREISGRTSNPVGNPFNSETLEPPFNGIANNDYSASFAEFLQQRPEGQPFCFWYGASELHRGFEKGVGLKAGKRLEDVTVPDFLPDTKGWEDSLKHRGVYASRERHSSSRWNNLTYPQRAMRTNSFLYIRNFKPERRPVGTPQKYDSENELGWLSLFTYSKISGTRLAEEFT